jgi:hypothetical protein
MIEHLLQAILLDENGEDYPTFGSLKRNKTVAPKRSNP